MPIELFRECSIRMLNVTHLPAYDPVPTNDSYDANRGLDGSVKQKGGNNATCMHHSYLIHTAEVLKRAEVVQDQMLLCTARGS